MQPVTAKHDLSVSDVTFPRESSSWWHWWLIRRCIFFAILDSSFVLFSDTDNYGPFIRGYCRIASSKQLKPATKAWGPSVSLPWKPKLFNSLPAQPQPLHWRQNGHDGVSSHQSLDCLLKRLQIKRKHQSSASLAFVRGIHRWPRNSPHKGPITRKTFPFDDAIMRQAFA